MSDSAIKSLEIKKLRTDGGTQSRVGVDAAHVDELAGWLAEHPSDDLPPVRVAKDPVGQLWLYGGFHRVAAYRKAGRLLIPAEVREGNQRDAVLWGLAENSAHGLKRTNADKRKAVETMLADSEWSELSDRQIAKACAVSNTFVASVRASAGVNVYGRNSLEADADEEEAGGTNLNDFNEFTPEEIEEAKRAAAEDRGEGPEVPLPDESPERNGVHEPLTDSEGNPVPEKAAPAFATAKVLGGLCRELDGIILRVEEIAKGPGGRLIRFDSFRQQVKDAKGNLWANRATHVCPYCKGTQDRCDACKGEGWVAKHIWQQAPGVK